MRSKTGNYQKKITQTFLESLSSRKAKNRDRQVEGGTEEALRLL